MKTPRAHARTQRMPTRRRVVRLSAPLVAATLLAGACATRINHDAPVSLLLKNPAPLRFAEFPYTSVEGEAWPEKALELPGVAQLYGMADVPRVTYVELNPDGEQPLVFVHGLGSYLKFWRYQLDAFAERGYRVLAIDMLGYGKSDKPASFPYTMEAMADVVREFIRTVAADHPVVVGHSMGGQTALSFAIRYPDELRAIVLASPAGFETFSRREAQWYGRAMTVGLIKGASEYSVWGSVRRNNFYHWKDDYRWLIEERVRSVETPEFDQYAYANVKSVQGLSDNNFVRESLEQVVPPTLIIYGDKDRLIPNPFFHGGWTSSIMESAHARIPDSRLVALSACGHMVQMDCHEDFNQSVAAFLAEIDATGHRSTSAAASDESAPTASEEDENTYDADGQGAATESLTPASGPRSRGADTLDTPAALDDDEVDDEHL